VIELVEFPVRGWCSLELWHCWLGNTTGIGFWILPVTTGVLDKSDLWNGRTYP